MAATAPQPQQPQQQGRRIVFWRHGQTTWNLQSRFQGQTDVPLDEAGQVQAQRAARMLAALLPEAIVASDLHRASDTAQALSQLAGVPLTLDADLRERDMGGWEGLSHQEVAERFPAEWSARQPVEGETPDQVAARVAPAVERALEKVSPGGTLVLVSHGASIRFGMAALLQLPPELWPRIGSLANCAWSVVEEGRVGWRLAEHNAGSLPEPVYSDDR